MSLPVYVSSGAFIGRLNGRDHRPFLAAAPGFACDGFEFMMYDCWYEDLEDRLADFAASSLPFWVWHVEKGIGELVGRNESGDIPLALSRFEINCRAARVLGAKKLVFHLWNGAPSDRHIERHIRLYGEFESIARAFDLCLTVENVVCAVDSPLAHMAALVHRYPHIKFTYDTKMASFHRENQAVFSEEYSFLWEHISHIHANDHSGDYRRFDRLRTLHIGEGAVDFAAFFAGAKQRSYKDSITLECSCMEQDGSINVAAMEKSLAAIGRLTAAL